MYIVPLNKTSQDREVRKKEKENIISYVSKGN